MTPTTYFCCDERRRDAVVHHETLNGIDFVEVVDDLAIATPDRQRTIHIVFVKPLAAALAATLDVANVVIEGGSRIPTVTVTKVEWDPATPTVLTVTVAQPGDFSFYTLRLVDHSNDDDPLEGFDPVLSRIEFSFKAECPSDFDCRSLRVCPPEPVDEPDIDYLAKDYASFRRLMLDRMSVTAPGWGERNPADLGVTLVELLAYVGDHLSYTQDAIATEAYLDTARKRVSVRRHARLVDYHMHDGCNARTWIHFDVSQQTTLSPHTQLFTTLPDLPARISKDTAESDRVVRSQALVFETIGSSAAPDGKIELFPAHNAIRFYTWGRRDCCLPKGATRATLRGRLDDLKEGDVLVFVERLGPVTGAEADADPTRRHAVRLTVVDATANDPLGETLDPTLQGGLVTEIEWDAADALPFALCISSRVDKDGAETHVDDVSVALGNIVLADHGRTVERESLAEVPAAEERRALADAADRCERPEPDEVPPRYRPRLSQGPLTHAATVKAGDHGEKRWSYDPTAPASRALRWSMDDVRPAVGLEDGDGTPWEPQRDLLSSDEGMPHFVVEIEGADDVTLRFGDDDCGKRPNEGTIFQAEYRIGNGGEGNVGADSIVHFVSADSALTSVRNPLPAQGGREAETIEEVRQRAPFAFRTQERAVTLDDYTEVARRFPGVQKAAARHRWTGSWYTVFLAVDRLGGAPVDQAFVGEMRKHLERFRLAGRDVEVGAPIPVSLAIEMQVCVAPSYLWGEVEKPLLETLSAAVLADGTVGAFHPDNFSFGDPVYLSPIYARAQKVPGVASVQVTKFERQGQPATSGLDDGVLTFGWQEIVRLDNDPSFPEHGVLTLVREDHA